MPFGRRGDGLAQSQGVQRLQSLLDGRLAGDGAPRQEHHRRSREDHRYFPDPARSQSGEYHAAGRGVRRDLPEPDPYAVVVARKRREVSRHEDRLYAASRCRCASGSGVAAEVRLHERLARGGTGRYRREFPDGRVAQSRRAQDDDQSHRTGFETGGRSGSCDRPRFGPHRCGAAQRC